MLFSNHGAKWWMFQTVYEASTFDNKAPKFKNVLPIKLGPQTLDLQQTCDEAPTNNETTWNKTQNSNHFQTSHQIHTFHKTSRASQLEPWTSLA